MEGWETERVKELEQSLGAQKGTTVLADGTGLNSIYFTSVYGERSFLARRKEPCALTKDITN